MTNYYATPELAAHYDADHAVRDHFAFYRQLARDLGVERVIDVGCGTGLLCSELAGDGYQVTVSTRRPQCSTSPERNRTRPTCVGSMAPQPTSPRLGRSGDHDRTRRAVLPHRRRLASSPGRGASRPAPGRAARVRDPQPGSRGLAHLGLRSPGGQGRRDGRGHVHRDGDLVTSTGDWVQGRRSWTTIETLRFPSWAATTAGLRAAGLEIADHWGDFAGATPRPDSPEWVILARPAI